MDWRATAAGLVVGALIGVTGMGGGSVMAPFLIVGLGVPPLQAVASGLAYSAATTAVGGWAHLRLGTTRLRTVLRLAVGSVPASISAVLLFTHLLSAEGVGLVVKRAVGLVLIALAVTLLLRGRMGERRPRAARRLPDWALTLGGGVVGVTTGLTSIGSGSLTTAFLSAGTDEEGQRIVGTVVVHTTILTFAAGAAHLAMGQIDAALTLSLLAGSIPGVLVGSRITVRIPEPLLRDALASILLILSILSYAPKPEHRAAGGAVPEALAHPAPSIVVPSALIEPQADDENARAEKPPPS